jgi:hypothetical protein
MTVYGPFTAAEHEGYVGNQNTMASKCVSDKLLLTASGIFGNGDGGAATKDAWNNAARVSKGEVVKTSQYKVVADVDTKYFITKYEVTATITSEDGETVGEGDIFKPFGPGFGDDDDEGLEHTLSIGWPRATLVDGRVADAGSGRTLAEDNTATAPKAAGSSSNVGAPNRGRGGVICWLSTTRVSDTSWTRVGRLPPV